MKALKGIIIFMGLLIFAGLGVIGVTLYKRATAPAESGLMDQAGPAAGGAPAGFGLSRLGLPAGSEVLEMQTEGRRLLLRVRRPEGGESVLVIDVATGALLGTLEITTGR